MAGGSKRPRRPGSGARFTVTLPRRGLIVTDIRERILILEDEKLLRMTMRKRLEDEGYRVFEAATGQTALELIRDDEPDLLLLDYKLPDMTGIDVLRQVREMHLDTSAILLTAFSSIGTAVEAMKLGAHDYLDKPVDYDELLATIAKALETTRLRREVRRHRSELVRLYGIANIVGRSKATEQILMKIRKVADSAASTVLIQGESGTGKDVVAKAIHYASSPRRQAVHEHHLHRPDGIAARVRDVRPRARRVHRREDARRRDCSRSPTAARCSSTRSATWARSCSRRCCASSRTRRSSAWAARWTSAWTCA